MARFTLDWFHRVVHDSKNESGDCNLIFQDSEFIGKMAEPKQIPKLVEEIADKPESVSEAEALALVATESFGVCKECAMPWADAQEERQEVERMRRRIRARAELRR